MKKSIYIAIVLVVIAAIIVLKSNSPTGSITKAFTKEPVTSAIETRYKLIKPTVRENIQNKPYIEVYASAAPYKVTRVDVYLYKDNELIAQGKCASALCLVNFTNLEDGNYSVNATATYFKS